MSITYPLVNVCMLQLDKAGADGSNVALLVGEGHTARTFWVLELWVCVNACVAHPSIQPVHDHG